MDSNTVYIYALINPLDNDVFYIGATVNPRSRLSLHIGSYDSVSKKGKILHTLNKMNIEPEMLILDTVTTQDAGYWEVFYTDLYRQYGFDLKICSMPYFHFDRKLARQKSKGKPWQYANSISGKIDGKDVHHYRRLVLKHFKFYQYT